MIGDQIKIHPSGRFNINEGNIYWYTLRSQWKNKQYPPSPSEKNGQTQHRQGVQFSCKQNT